MWRNGNGGFREKVSDFSLDLQQIRPSAVFETRGETALRGESSRGYQIYGVSSNFKR